MGLTRHAAGQLSATSVGTKGLTARRRGIAGGPARPAIPAPSSRPVQGDHTGGELDNAEIQGSVDSVTVEEDGSFTVNGSWDGGEAYTLTGVTGSCTNF